MLYDLLMTGLQPMLRTTPCDTLDPQYSGSDGDGVETTHANCEVSVAVSGELPLLHSVGWCSYDQHGKKVEGLIQGQGCEATRGRDEFAQEETGKIIQGCRGHAFAVRLKLVYVQVYVYTSM